MAHCCGWWGQLVHGSNCAKQRLLKYFTDCTSALYWGIITIWFAAAENFNCSLLPTCSLTFCHKLGINSSLCKLQNCVSCRVCRGKMWVQPLVVAPHSFTYPCYFIRIFFSLFPVSVVGRFHHKVCGAETKLRGPTWKESICSIYGINIYLCYIYAAYMDIYAIVRVIHVDICGNMMSI